VVAWLAPHHNAEQTAGLPCGCWVSSWVALARNGWEWLGGDCHRAWAVTLLVTLLFAWVPAVRQTLPAGLAAAGCLLLAALLYFLFLGTRKWMLLNEYSPRYLLPCLTLVQGGLVLVAAAPLWSALGHRSRRSASFLAAPALLLVAAWSCSLPSLRGVRA